MTRDVLIIGGGPVGLTLALLLGRHGVRVTVLERDRAPAETLRAVALDDECLRIWQACGIEAQLEEDWDGGTPDGVICRYVNGRGRTFLRLNQRQSDLGYPHAVVIHEARIARKLARAVDRSPSIEFLAGHRVSSLDQDEAGVRVCGLTAADEPFSLRGSWAVACDGGASTIRPMLGIEMQGRKLRNPWLIANLIDDQAQDHAQIRCDPRGPSISISLPHGVRRIERMLAEDDDGSWLEDDDSLRRKLSAAWPGAATAPIIERFVVRFAARIAERWRCGRVFLAGDAAHTTPPFAGQGLATGLRDASNLAFKLAGVCQGWLAEDVLDTYEAERRPHQERMLRLALRLGALMMPRSRLGAFGAQLAIRVLSVFGPVRRQLQLRGRGIRSVCKSGFLAPGGKAGHYLPQPWIAVTGKPRLRLDALLGPRMTWLAVGATADRGRLNGLSPSPGDTVLVENRDFKDPQGVLQHALGAGSLVLVRPDRVIHTHLQPTRA